MGSYISKKCPQCGNTYYHGRTYLGDDRRKYGSPIRKCSFCGKEFVDKEYVEAAIEGMLPEDKMSITPSQVFFGLIAIGIGVLVLMAGIHAPCNWIMIILSSLWLVFWIWAIFFTIFSHPQRKEEFEKELQASKKRLKNPNYAWTLKRLGLDVPSEYLYPFSEDNPLDFQTKKE